MDSEFIKRLKKDIEEIRNRTLAIERRVEIAEREAIVSEGEAIVSEREADAAWEFVMKTREEIKTRREMTFWKKIFG